MCAASLATLLVALAAASVAPAATIQRFALNDQTLLGGIDAQGIAAGADGNVWFYDSNHAAIARMTPTGSVTEFNGVTSDDDLIELAAGPDGNIWFTEGDARRIGRVTPSGVVTKFSRGISAPGGPIDIAAGPDGNIWYTQPATTRVGRVTPAGVVTEFSKGITPGSGLAGITAGPDGNVWFGVLADSGSRIARVTPAGEITEFSAGLRRGSDLWEMTAGPDGNVWFTDQSGAVGRITPAGKITEFTAGIGTGAEPSEIATGPDGNLWFTESEAGRLGRVTPAGRITEFSAGLNRFDFIYSSITAGPGGRLWFASFDGIAALTPTPGTAVSVLTQRARVSTPGSTSATLVCGAGTEPCAGRIELTITIRETVRPGGGQPPFTLPKLIVVGSGRYALRPGARGTARVTLNASGLRRLARRGRLDVRYRAASSAGDAAEGSCSSDDVARLAADELLEVRPREDPVGDEPDDDELSRSPRTATKPLVLPRRPGAHRVEVIAYPERPRNDAAPAGSWSGGRGESSRGGGPGGGGLRPRSCERRGRRDAGGVRPGHASWGGVV